MGKDRFFDYSHGGVIRTCPDERWVILTDKARDEINAFIDKYIDDKSKHRREKHS